MTTSFLLDGVVKGFETLYTTSEVFCELFEGDQAEMCVILAAIPQFSKTTWASANGSIFSFSSLWDFFSCERTSSNSGTLITEKTG